MSKQLNLLDEIQRIGKPFPFTDICDENRVVQNHVDVSFVEKLYGFRNPITQLPIPYFLSVSLIFVYFLEGDITVTSCLDQG